MLLDSGNSWGGVLYLPWGNTAHNDLQSHTLVHVHQEFCAATITDHNHAGSNVSQQKHRTNTHMLVWAAVLVLIWWAVSFIDYCSSFNWCGPG